MGYGKTTSSWISPRARDLQKLETCCAVSAMVAGNLPGGVSGRDQRAVLVRQLRRHVVDLVRAGGLEQRREDRADVQPGLGARHALALGDADEELLEGQPAGVVGGLGRTAPFAGRVHLPGDLLPRPP